jgi:hypothetical protein
MAACPPQLRALHCAIPGKAIRGLGRARLEGEELIDFPAWPGGPRHNRHVQHSHKPSRNVSGKCWSLTPEIMRSTAPQRSEGTRGLARGRNARRLDCLMPQSRGWTGGRVDALLGVEGAAVGASVWLGGAGGLSLTCELGAAPEAL